MDIGFETIIYIVLGLVFVLAQVAKKKKKAAQAQMSDDEEIGEVENQSPASFFEQLLGIPDQKPIVQKAVEKNQFPPDDLDPSFSQPGSRVSITTPINDTAVIPKARPVVAPQGYHNKKSGKQSRFNLRTAVIYKVVLERKNF